MHSNAIHDSLSRILRSPITYISLVTHNESDYFMCVGSHSFFMVDSKLENIRAEVFYAHVQRLIVDTSKNKYLLIQLSDNRDPRVPVKLVLSTENRKALTDQLRSSWKTDYMFRLGQVMDLPVFQGEVSGSNNSSGAKVPPIPHYLLEPMSQWELYEAKTYKFFIPNAYKKTNVKDNTFYYYTPQKKLISKISIQVSEDMALDALSYMDGKEEINIYCEEYAAKIASTEPKVWIMSSKPYFKRMNLNQDIACWQGWEVHMRTPKRDILVIFLRRKYIPPLLDYFVDFIVVIEGPEQSANALAKLAPGEKNFANTGTTLGNGRRVADSFYASFTTLTIYDAFIKGRADALYYDEETLNYLKYRLPNKIKPSYVLYGVAFVVDIAKIIFKNDSELNVISEMLREKYEDESENWTEEWDPFDDPLPWDKVKKALEDKLTPHKKKNSEEKNESWDFKVSRYLAYCVDGGLLNAAFNLNLVLEFYLTSSDQDAEKLNFILLYLLHFKADKSEAFDFTASLATKIYEMLYSKAKYLYNQKVMVNMLEAGYFKKELGGSDKPLLYSKFLTHMLENSTNTFIKNAICTQINKDQNEKKGNATNMDVNITEVKALVRPLLSLYQGENFKLASLAVIALASLCSKMREIKQLIMQEGDDIILKKLDPKDENLLFFTLRLLQNLMLVSQNIQTFVGKGIVQKILDLLKGSGIVGVFYSDKTLTLLCQILGMIVTSGEEYKKLVTKHIESITGLFLLPRSQPISEDLVAEIMNLFMIRIIDKDIKAIETIGENCLDILIEKLKQGFFRTKDLQNRILTFLLGFKDVDKMMMKIRQSDIIGKVEEYKMENKHKALALLKEIEAPTKKANEQGNES